MVKGGNYAVFNVTQGITYTWSTCGSSGLAFNTQLTLFEGSTCGSGTVLAYNDDECGNKSSITWTATFTGTVTLLVSKYNCQVSSGYLEIPVSLKWSAIDNTGCDGDFCISARPFCTGTTYNFPAGVNSGVGEAGPNYCCLQTTPNPVWYYLFIDQPGNIDIYIHSDQSQDLDFICWGPFNNIFDPCQNPETYLTNSNSTCDDHHASGPGGGYPNGNTVDCSYDAASTEWCYIPNAQVGQFYILLITNYSNNPNNIIFEQTNAGQPGAGHTNCDIVYCSMTGLTAVPGTCDPATNSYSVSGQITFSNPPPGGQLVVTDNSGTTQSFNSPFTSPISYTLNGITSDGASHTITAYFTYAPSCSMTITYMAPASCVSCNATAGPTSTICQGESVQLTATGGVTYSWSPTTGLSNPNISNPIASPTSTTTYTVTTTDAQGCTASASVSITVTTSPNVSITATPQNICFGQTSTLTASGATSYTWSTGSTLPIITVSPTSTTTYSVTGTNGTCTGSASVTVNASANLNVSVNANPSSVCLGGSTTLTASGVSSYLWNTGASTASITVSPSTTTTYSVTGANGTCTGSASISINVNPSPTISITAIPPVICGGGSSTLTATGANMYVWNSGATTANITVSPNSTTTYTVTGTNSYDCTNSASITVQIFSSPNVNAGTDKHICLGDSVQLQATGSLFYSWTPTNTLNNSNISNPIANPTTTTTYIVSGFDFGGNLVFNGDFENGNVGFTSSYIYDTIPPLAESEYCVIDNPNSQHVNFSPCIDHTPGAGNQMLVINASSIPGQNVWCQTIQISPNTYYAFSTWLSSVNPLSPAVLQFSINGNVIGSNFNASDTTCVWHQFYQIWYSSNNTTADICIVNQNTELTGNDFALDDITFSPLCYNTDTVIVFVDPNPTITISPSNPSICIGESLTLNATSDISNTQFYWSNNLTGNTITVNPTTSTTYTVTGSLGGNCTSSANITVGIKQNPIITITASDTFICLGQNVQLMANGGDTYQWSNGNSGQTISVMPQTNTTYTVTATLDGCTSTQSINIFVYPNPEISYDITPEHCNKSDGSININIFGGIPPYQYNWSNGVNTANLNNISAGIYNLTVIDANGCSNTINITLTEAPMPQANFAPKPQITTIDNPIIYFENYSTGASFYEWDFGDGYSSTYFSPTHAYDFPGVYHVVLSVSDQYGCVDTVGANIIINDVTNIFLPNAFTPNGNNINELYNIMGTGIDPSTFEMRIFDRWGKQLFYTTDYSASWDGTYNGEPVPQGSYIIAIKYSNKNNGNKYYIVDKIVILK